jgi:hypothetical protein
VAQTLLSSYLLSALAKVAGREVPLPKNERIFKPDTSWLGQPIRTRIELSVMISGADRAGVHQILLG